MANQGNSTTSLGTISKAFLLALLIALAAYVPSRSTSPLTSPLESPIRLYFPTISKNAIRIKKGVAQPSQYDANCELIAKVADWYYDYTPIPKACPGVESVAMAWDERAMDLPMGGTSRWVMGPNECDLYSQCGQTPQQMVPMWRVFEQNNEGRLLVAPSTVDFGWLYEFRELYIAEYGEPPRFNALSMHIYCETPNADSCAEYFENVIDYYRYYADLWGVKELWLTEFAHITKPVEFLENCLPWLETKVDRYAWFATEYPDGVPWWLDRWPNTSLWRDGVLTKIGEAYE